MFSEALKIMDQNTVRFMMDEMQQELSDAKTKLSDTKSELSDTKQQFINYIITTSKEQSASKEETSSKLMSNFHITKNEADALIEKYW